jgi:cell division septation protein DedD
MSPDRDSRFPPTDKPDDDDLDQDDAPRSIFTATWFRIVIVLLGVAVVGAVAVPYVLDVVNPPATVDKSARAPAPPPGASSTPAPEKSPAPTASALAAEAPKTDAKLAAKPEAVAGARKEPAKSKAREPAEKAAAKKTPAPTERTAAAPRPAAAPAPARARAKTTEAGDYFVQVGAFKDEETAKRLAARLRDQNYPVDESVKRVGGAAAEAPRPAPRASTPAVPDRYEVIVSGGSAADINAKLAAKGLASEPAGDGVRIRPSLLLRDAVALSKDLSSDGFKVQVRRGGGAAEPGPAAAATTSAGGQTLYRVRVGGYPDRAAAQTVLRELQEKGFQPFIAKRRE